MSADRAYDLDNDEFLDKGELVNFKDNQGNYKSHNSGGVLPETWNAPVDNMDRLNDKIISSHNTNRHIVITKPRLKKMKVAFPLLDDNKQMVMHKGIPVIDKIREIEVHMGIETRKFFFPIPDWFNDSVTSSVLEKSEAQFIREIDDLAFSLWIEQMLKSKIDHSEFINKLYWLKASIADAAKGVGGAAVVNAKTTISKSESSVHEYRKNPILEHEKRMKKSGLLGMGWFGGLI